LNQINFRKDLISSFSKNKFRGCWNLPYITDVILMKSDLFKRINIIYEDPDLDSSLKFAENLRNKV